MSDWPRTHRRQPEAAAASIVAFLSLVRIPPLIGFVGKFTLFLSAIEGGYAWLAILAIANSVLSLFYYARVIGRMVFQHGFAPGQTFDRWTKATMLAAGLI